ncbi:Leucine-rich repeat serine/threonine-protein kinase 1-like [Oopsacas minuta]|uniref:Leucine-rich repeat serine/threonine-protein kinase 1-like n=1 Tax=Oopsacas minuta TaxID=111878 RepID=A0AAV7K7K6_9METZ|nr:Leucine-rich repeat serine/threonine-protein kinase 1-like [Oopsacas minuta]
MYPNERRKTLSISEEDVLRLCREGELIKLRRLLEDEDHYQQKIHLTFGKYKIPLIYEAVEHSQTLIVQYLLCKEVDVNCKVAHRNFNTPLLAAINKGNEEIIKMLLERNACTSIPNESDETPMYRAQKLKKRNIEFLLRSHDIVTKAREMCEENSFKDESQTNLSNFKSELDNLGINFHYDCANTCLLYFAKRDMHTLSAKCIIAGADNFEQAILFAEKTNSTKTLSQLLLCQAAKYGDYNKVSELLGDPPSPSNLWYLPTVQRHLSTYFHSDMYLRKPALIISLREGHFFTAGTLLKHCRHLKEDGSFCLDWGDLSLKNVHEIWMHNVSPWVEYFILSKNKLTSLPNTFLSLLNIRVLDLSHNNLTGTLVIIDLMRLQTIEKLRLSDNKLRELPNSIIWPPSLTYLDISRNKLSTLPSCMSSAKIECLVCQGNSFPQLPNSLYNMTSLKIIDLKDNLINGFSDIETIMAKFQSESVKFINPDGEIFRAQHNETITENTVIVGRPIRQSNTILNSLKKLNVIKRSTFKSPDIRKICLTLIGEKNLHLSIAHKLQAYSTDKQNYTTHVHDSLMHFSWIYTPNFLRNKKIAFNTMVLKNCSKYSRFVSCFLPETHLIGVIHDAGASIKDTEANLIRPLTQLVGHLKKFALILFVHDLKADDPDADLIFREKRDTLMILLEKYHLTEHINDYPIYRNIDFENLPSSDVTEVQRALYDIAGGVLLQDPKFHTTHLHSEVEHLLSGFRDYANDCPQQMDRRAMEAQLKKNLGGDFVLQENMLEHLKEIGAVLFFDVPLNDLSLCVFVNPGWIIVLIMHICDVMTHHHAPVISEDTLKEKLAPKCQNAFTASLTFLKQILQILINFDLIVPIQQSLYLIPLNLPLTCQAAPLSLSEYIYQMQFKRESIESSFWNKLVAQVMKKLDLAQGFVNENRTLTSEYLLFERMGAQFCLSKIKERTEFDGFSIATNGSGDSFDVLATTCSLIHTFIYQNFFFTRHKNEICKSLQVCIPCSTCIKLSIHSPKHFVFDSVLLCLHEEEEMHCSQHDVELNLDNLRPDVYFHDIPRHLRTLDFHPKSILRRSNTRGGSADHTYEYQGQMVTIRIYHFNSSTPLLPFYTMSNEVRLLYSLQHDNVVRLLGFNADALYVITEQLPQLSLAAFLESPSHQLDRLTVFSFARQIISAVEYLHSRGVVYRSLQPANILITSFDYMDTKNLILSDFREAAFITPLGVRGHINRAEYQAPEMLRYEGTQWYNELIDVFAFGHVLKDMITAVVPNTTELPARGTHWKPYSSFSESLMSISTNLSIHSSAEQTAVSESVYFPGYKLYTDMMIRCWSHVLRDRPPASLLHYQLSRLEFHLFQTAAQPPDPILIHFFVQVALPDNSAQVWAIGDDAHLNSLEYELSVIYIYDQDMVKLLFTIDVLNQIVAVNFCTLLRVVWTAEKQTRFRNNFITPLSCSVINAYSPVSFNKMYQFSVEDEVVAINSSHQSLFLGLNNCTILMYSMTSQSSMFPFSNPTRRISLNALGNCSKVRVIDILEDRTVWIACGATLSIFKEQEDNLIPCKEIILTHQNTDNPEDNICDFYVSHLLSDQVNRVMWVADSKGYLMVYDLHTMEKWHEFDELYQINNALDSHSAPKQLEIQSMCLSRDLVWLGITSGHILLVNRYKITSWIRAHKSKVKCLFHLSTPSSRGDQLRGKDCVISTGTGCHIDPKVYQEMNYFLKWEALGKDRLELLEHKCKRTSFMDELHSFF